MSPNMWITLSLAVLLCVAVTNAQRVEWPPRPGDEAMTTNERSSDSTEYVLLTRLKPAERSIPEKKLLKRGSRQSFDED